MLKKLEKFAPRFAEYFKNQFILGWKRNWGASSRIAGPKVMEILKVLIKILNILWAKTKKCLYILLYPNFSKK